MSWDLSSEDAITEKLESQHRTILAFAQKIKQLEQQLSKLRAQLDEAEKVVAFYADPEKWILRKGEAWNKCDPKVYGDDEIIRHYKHPDKDWTGTITVGGKKARAYQAKYSQKLEGDV